MIRPVLQHDELLADIRAAAAQPGFRLWWLGQSGFLVQHEGRHLLIDPYLSDSLTKKYAATDKPHVRMTELAIGPERLDFVDVVTSSHNHTDHLDGETLGPLLRVNPGIKLIIPEANRAFVAARLGIDAAIPIGLREGGSTEAVGFHFTGIRSAHEELSDEYMGYVIRFGGWALYHPGDTVLYEGMAEQLRPFAIDVALLPINGRGPERRVAGNLWGREAAGFAREIAARLVIPMHYEMFDFNTAPPDEFVAESRRLGQPCRVVRCGERWSSSEL
jgi:L-ascorbate metabolism protein UlaG (beta-lactamase superfamily)